MLDSGAGSGRRLVVRTELVGRDREIAVLDASLAAALDGQPGIVLCRGEPGIGKTRLADELADRAREQCVPAVWGRAVDSDGAPPFWPWRQLLRTTADVVDLAGWPMSTISPSMSAG